MGSLNWLVETPEKTKIWKEFVTSLAQKMELNNEQNQCLGLGLGQIMNLYLLNEDINMT